MPHINIKTVIANIKSLVKKENKKVFDKEVAELLRIPQLTFAQMKNRNSIPYAEIIHFCKRTGQEPMSIFY